MAEPHVVIIGGGFGGLAAARELKRAPVRVTVVDARNHHLFQPLLYQVATAALAAPDIAAPIRTLLAGHDNATVFRRAVTGIDLARKKVLYDGGELAYDYLVVAAGARNHYYGHDGWAAHAPGLKSIDDAFEIRRRILVAYEEAELCTDPERRRALLTFVVVGAGATGVELAGALAEIAKKTMRKQFRNFDPADARVVLVEGGPRVLAAFPEDLSEKARARLEKLGVEVRLETRVQTIDVDGVALAEPGGRSERIVTPTVLWAAGVGASPLAAMLGPPDKIDRGGRIVVNANLSVPGHPEVFAVGDMAAMAHAGGTVPGVAQGALQGGRHAAREIKRHMAGRESEAFRYKDKGTLATIGRMSAVAELGRVHTAGVFAWFLWVFVHIMYLASFRNRVIVLMEWAWAWFSWSRPGRIILDGTTSTAPPPPAPTTPPPSVARSE
ncbi:MAG: NAD(P)/FAD-dependent oxidoreductase [Myxococcota bacterium]